MPCYRCGRVQTDPGKGSSPWAVGVIEEEQILVCPTCQAEHAGWVDELRTCPSCRSTRLSIKMGSLYCRSCDYLG